ncbi:hypothetical protein LINPERPRIM_LOCUS3340 [Linum perenne]
MIPQASTTATLNQKVSESGKSTGTKSSISNRHHAPPISPPTVRFNSRRRRRPANLVPLYLLHVIIPPLTWPRLVSIATKFLQIR